MAAFTDVANQLDQLVDVGGPDALGFRIEHEEPHHRRGPQRGCTLRAQPRGITLKDEARKIPRNRGIVARIVLTIVRAVT